MLEHMRLHILLEDDLVAEIDRRAGKRKRSDFIARINEQYVIPNIFPSDLLMDASMTRLVHWIDFI